MEKVLLTNAFSINMLKGWQILYFQQFEHAQVRTLFRNNEVNIDNAIGHVDTDRVVRAQLAQLGVKDVPVGERKTVKLSNYVAAVVAQYSGPRLEVGATELPEGAEITFWLVTRR